MKQFSGLTKKIKIILIFINEILAGWIFSFVVQQAYLLISNSTKGAGNNPNGEAMIPLGYFLLLVCVILATLGVACFFIFQIRGKWKYLLFILSFLTGIIYGVLWWEHFYTLNHVLNIFRFV